MAEHFYLIEDPDYSEFVFNCMMESSAEERRQLSPQELQFFRTESAMRRFADNESKEKRDLLLARIGIRFCTIYAPANGRVDYMLDEVFTQYQFVEKRMAITQAMSKNKIFVQSSNDVLVGVHMAAQNSHSQVYVLNYNYVKLHRKIVNWKSASRRSDTKDAMEAFDIVAALTLATLNTSNEVEGICGVNERQIKILLALYTRRHTFTTHITVANLTGDSGRTKGVQHLCHDLEENGFIAREPGYSKISHRKNQNYMIMSKGINAVMDYLKYLHKQTLQ